MRHLGDRHPWRREISQESDISIEASLSYESLKLCWHIDFRHEIWIKKGRISTAASRRWSASPPLAKGGKSGMRPGRSGAVASSGNSDGFSRRSHSWRLRTQKLNDGSVCLMIVILWRRVVEAMKTPIWDSLLYITCLGHVHYDSI
jgi:hypothetical protein